MLAPSDLQLRLMPEEAQRLAIERLAARGWDARTISAQTGLAEPLVERILKRASSSNSQLHPLPKWKAPGIVTRRTQLAGPVRDQAPARISVGM